MNSHSKKAGLLSILFMGLGQFYNRQFAKGLFLALIELVYIIFLSPFLAHGLWGIATLGETPQKMAGSKIIQGDHSIYLLIIGIISIILIFIFALFYVINFHDARLVGKRRDEGGQPNGLMDSLHVLTEKGFPYIMLIPAIVFTLFLTAVPLLFGILIAFTNYSSPNHLPPRSLVSWVGLGTFIDLFGLNSWKNTLIGVGIWTIVWAVFSTLTSFFAGMVMAAFLNSNGVKLKKFWRTVFIIPWAVPGFIAIMIMRNIFNTQFGPLNQYLASLNLGGIPWLTEATWAKIVCIIVNMWFGMPYFMALMSGVMTGIPKDMYESAEVEGAGGFYRFRKITVPMVMFATAPLLIMSFAYNFNNFTLIYLLTVGDPVNNTYAFAGNTDILLSWIYKLTLERQQYNLASAVSIIVFVVIATVSIFSFSRSRSFKEEDMMR